MRIAFVPEEFVTENPTARTAATPVRITIPPLGP
jgi:hypothetical protein